MNVLGPLGALASSITWATTSGKFSELTKKFSGFDVNFSRAAVAFPFLLVTWMWMDGVSGVFYKIITLPKQAYGYMSLSILCSYGLGDALFYFSSRIISLSTALTVACTYPLLMTLYGAFFMHQTLQPIAWLGSLISILGLIVVVSSPSTTQKSKYPKILGYGLALLTAISWSMNGIMVFHSGEYLCSIGVATLRMGLAMLISCILSLISLRQPAKPIASPQLKKYFWYFWVESYIGTIVYAYGMIATPLALSGVLSSLAPVWSLPISWWNKTESFSLKKTLGVCSVIAGIIFLILFK